MRRRRRAERMGWRRKRTKWPRQPGRVRDRLSMMLVPTMGLESFSEREPLLSPTRHVSVPAPTAHVMRTDHLARRGLQLVPASVRAGLRGGHTADGVHKRAHDSGTRENAGIARGSGPRAGKPHLHRPPTRYGRRCRTLPLRAMHQDRLLIPSPAFPPSFYSPRRLLPFRLPCRPSRPQKYLEPNQRSPCLLPDQSSASIIRCHTLSMYGPPRPSLRS